MDSKLKSNIWKYYLFKLFWRFMLFTPVIVLFFQENGLSMTEILVLQSVYSIAIVLLEVPTGAIGDFFGKKASVATGSFIFAIGMVVYSLGYSFLVFLFAEIICALGGSLISGSDSAFIHGTLKSLNRGKDYKKIEGTAKAFGCVGIIFAGLLGGYVGSISLRLTMAGSAIMAFLSFIIILTVKEPVVQIKIRENYRDLIINSMRIVRNHKLALWLFFLLFFGFSFCARHKLVLPALFCSCRNQH